VATAPLLTDTRSRTLSLLAAAALHVAGVAGLIEAFGVRTVVAKIRGVAAFAVPLAPPPPPPPPPPSPSPTPPPPKRVAPKAKKPDPAPSPRARAAPAPQPSPARRSPRGDAPRLEAASPRRAAPTALVPAHPSLGVTPAPPSATAGAGGSSAGPRAGGEAETGAIVRRAEKIAGELVARDFPRSGADERDGRFVIVRFAVGPDGRVANCRVAQSSGNPEVDAITCRLIEQRFRYRPARDGAGRPVSDVTGWKQWRWQ
jgi:periplasmic protein TonB